jgi:hypothetical protein
MENLNTDSLMKLQVEQLEKEKKELNERLRIVAKRVDHIERAYRKEERPLLGRDYEEQQANDRSTFEALQTARVEGSKISHQQDIETKKRLSRMMDDYQTRRDDIAAKRGDDFAKRKEEAARKIDEEKAKRRKVILQEREKERLRVEEEERIQREKEEEEARLEAGTCLQSFSSSRSLIDVTLQSASLKLNVFAKRRKLPLLPPNLPNVRQRRKQPLYANNAKKNGPPLQNKHVFVYSAKKKPRSVENNAKRMNELLPEILQWLELQMEMRQHHGDVLHLQMPQLQYRTVRQSHHPDRKVQVRQNTDQVLWQVPEEEDGEIERQRNLAVLCLLLLLDPLRLP